MSDSHYSINSPDLQASSFTGSTADGRGAAETRTRIGEGWYRCPPGTGVTRDGAPKEIGLSDSTYLNTDTPLLSKIIPEICGVKVYKSSVVPFRYPGSPVGGGERGEITHLSNASRSRLAFVASNATCDFPSMMTLTFKDVPTDGKQVKKTLNAFLVWYRRHFPGEKYLWFIEFQRRGSPHFHILSTVDLAKRGKLAKMRRKGRKPWRTHYDTFQNMQEVWQRLGGGLTSWEVIEHKDGAKHYAVKYATKTEQKRVPLEYRDVGRFWGHSKKGVAPTEKDCDVFYCSEDQLRTALQNGGWSYLKDDWEIFPKELYNAADFLDTSVLDGKKPSQGVKDDIMRATGRAYVGKVLHLRDEVKESMGSVEYIFQCDDCGQVFEKWRGQCECGEWNTVIRVEGVSKSDIEWFL